MTAVLGVDGGQSGIRMRRSSDPRVIEVAGVSRLEGDTVVAVADAVAEGWRRGAFDPVDRVMLGLSTAPVDAAECDRLCSLVGRATGAGEVWLADDSVSAHAGALSEGWGVSLVAGTGVASLAVRRNGEPRIIGGHGYLLGDEGGAFWLGSSGLRAVLRAAEGRAPLTSMTELAERRFGDISGLPVRLHGGTRPVNTIAEFARDVLEATDSHDVVASAIVEQAAQELLAVAQVGADWVGGAAVPLGLGGRMLDRGSALRHRLESLLASERGRLSPRDADGSGLDGAVRLGGRDDLRSYDGLIHRWSGVVA